MNDDFSRNSLEGAPHAVSVYDYDDYHDFLRDWMESKRKTKGGFSFQVLANRAGLKSRSFLRLVSLGEKDLLHATALKLVGAMGFDDRETEFFLALVGYNNSVDPKDRAFYQSKLKASRKPSQQRVLSAQQYDLFSKWYIGPVWELVVSVPFDGDYARIAHRLDPQVSTEDVRSAVELLLELDLIEAFDGGYRQKNVNIHTSEKIASKAIKEYQTATMNLAGRALDVVPLELRQINTLTLGFDLERWNAAKVVIGEFRQKLVDLAGEVPKVDRVYQVNVQAFPLTRMPDQA